MYRRFTTMALGMVLAIGLASPAVAGNTKTEITGTDTLLELLDPGRTWQSDGIQHVRGWTGRYATDGEPDGYIDGTSVVVANWNLDLASGDGTMWGTTDLDLSGVEGGWHQTWVATFDAGVWSGWGVGRGWGDLRGMQIRLDVWSTGFGTDEFSGFVR